MSASLRILIADDHALLREGFIGLLKVVNNDWEFEQAESFQDVCERLDSADFDVLVIDLQMPGMNGVESLNKLRADQPTLKIAVLTGTETRSVILECLAAGVHGYIPKSLATAELLTAVNTIVSGGVYVPAALSRLAPVPDGPAPAPAAQPLSTLTARQHDVMMLLAQGMSTKMIARHLSLGVGTVKVHLAALYRTLDVHTRMEAVIKSGALIKSE